MQARRARKERNYMHANPTPAHVPEQTPTIEELRLDVALEARRGIADLVGCRVCGDFVKTPLGQKKTGHLAVHHPEMTVHEYKAAYPCARLCSFVYIANANAKSGRGSTGVQELMANFAAKCANGKELTECRLDMKWEENHAIKDFVVCRRCGFKAPQLRGGTGHLGLHGWTVEDYLREYPGAPRQSIKYAAAEKELSTKPEVKARRKAANGRWIKTHPLGPKTARDNYYAKPENKEKIRKAHAQIRKDARQFRALAQQAQQTTNKKVRPLSKETAARITAYACLSIQNVSNWDKGPLMYPKQNIRDNAYKSVVEFAKPRRYKAKTDAERRRIELLSAVERQSELRAALSTIKAAT
jgi:hypothetical protein